jgi:hypothetical protein
MNFRLSFTAATVAALSLIQAPAFAQKKAKPVTNCEMIGGTRLCVNDPVITSTPAGVQPDDGGYQAHVIGFVPERQQIKVRYDVEGYDYADALLFPEDLFLRGCMTIQKQKVCAGQTIRYGGPEVHWDIASEARVEGVNSKRQTFAISTQKEGYVRAGVGPSSIGIESGCRQGLCAGDQVRITYDDTAEETVKVLALNLMSEFYQVAEGVFAQTQTSIFAVTIVQANPQFPLGSTQRGQMIPRLREEAPLGVQDHLNLFKAVQNAGGYVSIDPGVGSNRAILNNLTCKYAYDKATCSFDVPKSILEADGFSRHQSVGGAKALGLLKAILRVDDIRFGVWTSDNTTLVSDRVDCEQITDADRITDPNDAVHCIVD